MYYFKISDINSCNKQWKNTNIFFLTTFIEQKNNNEKKNLFLPSCTQQLVPLIHINFNVYEI